MKISTFNNKHLAPLLSKVLQEERKCLIIGDFNINFLSMDRNQRFKILRNFVFEFFCSLHCTANKVGKKL